MPIIAALLTGFFAYLSTQARQDAENTLTQIKAATLVSDMGMRMRAHFRSGLTELEQFQAASSNEQLRSLAAIICQRISADYDSIYGQQFENYDMQSIKGYLSLPPETTSDSQTILVLADAIGSTKDLETAAIAFVMLRRATGFPFRMFDFETVRIWNHNRTHGAG